MPLCKTLGKETYMPTILVVFDGDKEAPEGEWVEVDDNIRLSSK